MNKESFSFYKPKEVEVQPLERTVMVHGAMNYKCESCGRTFRMWLEKGLEDKMQDKILPEKHKPVPFTIGCLCGGMVSHFAWQTDITLDDYRPLGSNMNYFENKEDVECGVPHLRTDGMTSCNTLEREIRSLRKESQHVEQRAEQPSLTGLEMYSTTQLKAELRRRKRMY